MHTLEFWPEEGQRASVKEELKALPAMAEYAFVLNDSPDDDDARFATVKSREDLLRSLTPLTRSRVSVLALADVAQDHAPAPEVRTRSSRRASKRQRPPTPVAPKGRKCGPPSRKAWCCVAPS